ncbi:Undecaprenyl-phosphate galactosephosphotransferase OS=Castellaniella defragrans (strain DSM/ CCUG 39792 / 65Phen) OX=1437824 GN=BN940_14946 PE=3 SV=1 [Castellaniella denitrificans]|uniref:undecaprenyl-phosphate glucose phosphotransferase n=1 Tax=Castellaniella sp. TaxID=1955812 RepID=UPI003D0A8ABB
MSRLSIPPPTLAERYPIAVMAGLVEFVLVVLAGVIAYAARFGNWAIYGPYPTGVVVMAVVVVLVQALAGCYQSWRGVSLLRQLGRVYSAWLLALALLASLAVLLHVSGAYSRIWFVMAAGLGGSFVTAFRLSMYLVLRRARARGQNLKRVVLIVSNQGAPAIQARVADLPEYGYHVAQVITLQSEPGWDASLGAAVQAAGAHELWLCLPLEEGAAIRRIVRAVQNLLIDVRYIPDLGDMPLLNQQVGEVAGMLTLDLNRSPMVGPMRWIKRAEDLIVGGLLSILILPICLTIAVAVKLSSPGPVLFKQYRTGINGRRFKVYKFRSMSVHQESPDTVTQAFQGDPRITPLGAFLRRTSLDELPQFFNVLQGRMSIVGPRPHALAHNDHYKGLVESYMQRHKVKPGITGWAQVNGYRGETDTLDKMEKRVEHDLWYINHWSLGLDLKIIAMTVFKGFLNRQP